MMRGIQVALGQDDDKARTLVLSSLSICAHDHVLSRMLLERFGSAKGRFIAIIGDWYNLSAMKHYDSTVEPPVAPPYEHGVRRALVRFIRDYLDSSDCATVVSENWGTNRTNTMKWVCPPPKFVFFGDNEVYHILTPDVFDPDLIEDAIISRHHWQTGVCSAAPNVTQGSEVNIEWLNIVVTNTRHVFVPAFDGGGYLIWSPEA